MKACAAGTLGRVSGSGFGFRMWGVYDAGYLIGVLIIRGSYCLGVYVRGPYFFRKPPDPKPSTLNTPLSLEAPHPKLLGHGLGL